MENKTLTYGEKAVGLTFNPSNDPKVQEVKELYAKIIDLIATCGADKSDIFGGFINEEAISSAMTAQMWAVKAITYKN